MKSKIIFEIQNNMKSILSQDQFLKLTKVLINTFENIEIVSKNVNYGILDNFKLLNLFISAKKVERCSIKTLKYYRTTLERMLIVLDKRVDEITTDDLRNYLTEHNLKGNLSKTTIDCISSRLGRMILSTKDWKSKKW